MHDPVVAGIAFEKRYKRVVDRSERTRGVQVHNVSSSRAAKNRIDKLDGLLCEPL